MMTTAKQTILIVDDDPQVRKLLTVLLRRDGYEILTAADGRQAIKAINEKTVDLVITDLIMPEKEGIETIMEIRQVRPGMPVIAISGGGKLNPQTYLNIAVGIGAVSTMAKPIDTARLKAIVRQLLSDAQPRT